MPDRRPATASKRALSALILGALVVFPYSVVYAQDEEEGGRAPQGPEIGLRLVAEGITSPVFLTEPPDGSRRLFVVDQAGRIRIIGRDGRLVEEPFLDIGDRLVELKKRYDERGLLGLAFHPDFRVNRRFFVYYSAPLRKEAPDGWNHTSRLSEFRASQDDPDRADPESERVVIEIDQPQANHNGGHITFGPDGLLYIPLGDGGRANDVGFGHSPQGNGQDPSNVLGSILRIDVNAEEGLRIPPDNPFVGRAGFRPEIWAYGFRNPYHISFDRGGSRELFSADAGQDRFEEVSIVAKGGNHGWRIKEGTHCFNPQRPVRPLPSCPSTGTFGEPLVDPVIEFARLEILSSTVVGGYVYRGTALNELSGRYIFGDYSRDRVRPQGQLFAAERRPSGLWPMQELRPHLPEENMNGRLNVFVLGFGEDNRGEMYLLGKTAGGPRGETGRVYRLVPRGAAELPEEAEETAGDNMRWAWIAGGVVLFLAVGALLARRGRRT